MNEKQILFALDTVDDKYLEEARPVKRQKNSITKIALAASLALIVGLSLWIGLGGERNNPDIPDNLYSEYYAGENYSRLIAILNNFGENGTNHDTQANLLDRFPLNNQIKPDGGNGIYVSVTENQVENVEEPDIIKMTDKYIFRIGGVKNGGEVLRIYTVDGDNTKQVCEYPIPYFDGNKYSVGAKMFL